MALPSIQVRLRDLHLSIDQLSSLTATNADRRFENAFNELKLVRATLAWESYLEETFICYLRGSRPISGRAVALSQPTVRNRLDATSLAISDSGLYGKWLNENWCLSRAAALFSGSHPFVILSSPTFPIIRHIRNRIVHRSDFAKAEFWSVVVSLYGSMRPGMTPGRLLTESSSGVRRIDAYFGFLKNAATIIAT